MSHAIPLSRISSALRSTLVVAMLGLASFGAQAQSSLLNVSYDVSRELYKDINAAFAASWKAKTGETVTVKQSHAGSTAQAQAVVSGLEADVVTMNQTPDVELLVNNGGLVAPDWRKRFPHDATPYTSTIVFLVRKGNPKQIKDWDDLTRPGVQVIVPNPKTSGNGRYTYLAAWGYGLEKSGSDAGAKDFVRRLFANVPILDGGGRGATTSFTQREIGDVLATFENEVALINNEVGEGKFDVVYPSLSIDAPAPVAVVQKVTDKRGTTKLAEAYLNFLFSPQGQEIIAQKSFRPRDPAVLKKYASHFPNIRTFSVEQKLGGWPTAIKTHFADGGVYDQIFSRR
jgi:sulfate/thiosulfate transport system substrate-binding protein